MMRRILNSITIFIVLISVNIFADTYPDVPHTDLIALKGREELPKFKKTVLPKYPKEAIKSGKEGRVVLKATIDINGLPKDIVAITNVGFGFEEASIDAIKQSTFYPGIINGKPVEVRVNVPYEFKLDPSISKMVLIPVGEFKMGSESGELDEEPMHTVYLSPFYIDKYEVTNAQYKDFVDANPKWQKDKILSQYHDGYYLADWIGNDYPSGKDNHPVVYVSWYAAMAYAKWVNKRLPTEAEWEKAARGELIGKKYPLGDTIDSTHANYFDGTDKEITPVGTYPANGYGIYDMAGNVREWCLDAYSENFYKISPRKNPIAGVKNLDEVMNVYINLKGNRVLRGGSWLNSAQLSHISNRHWRAPTASNPNEGFRCVKEAVQDLGKENMSNQSATSTMQDVVFVFSNPISFGEDIEITSIAKKDIERLLDQPRVFDGKIWGVRLRNDEDKTIEVETCREYINACNDGYYHDMPNSNMRSCISFQQFSDLLKAIKVASVHHQSFISSPKIGLRSLELLPLSFFPWTGDRKKLMGATYQSMVDEGVFAVRKVDESSLTIEEIQGSMGQELEEVVRADFNGDGIEDLLLFEYNYAIGATLAFGGCRILTKKSKDGKFETVDPMSID